MTISDSPAYVRAAYRRNLLAAALPTLAVPVVIGGVMLALGVALSVGPLVAGALGWLIALVLRAPVAVAAMRFAGSQERAQPWITASSGPLEEGVRLVVLLVVGRDPATAAAIGLGWAAIEVLYSLVNGVAMLSLLGRDDPEAQQARALMPMRAALEPSAPWWGLIERITASVLHIGFTLIVAAQPLLAVVTAPVHSAVNLALLRAGRSASLARLEATLAIVAAFVLAVAVALWMPR